jgi:hypothetical protein
MNSGQITQENFIVAPGADRYGHPKQTCPTGADIQVKRGYLRFPQADRFGHVTNRCLWVRSSQYPKP